MLEKAVTFFCPLAGFGARHGAPKKVSECLPDVVTAPLFFHPLELRS